MQPSGRRRLGLLSLAVTGSACLCALGQSPPAATTPAAAPALVAATIPATAPASPATASAPARKVTVNELLPKEPVTLTFNDVPIKDVLTSMGTKYGFDVVCHFDFTTTITDKADNTQTEQPQRMTLVGAKLTARQAISLMNGTLEVIGYSIVENVRGDPPRVVLTVLSLNRDSARIPIYFGQDPVEIPEGEERRTQVMTLSKVDAAQAKDDIEAILGKTEITINEPAKQLIITDTGSRVKTAARTLQLMEKKAGAGNK